MTNIGLMSYYLGIEIKQREDGILWIKRSLKERCSWSSRWRIMQKWIHQLNIKWTYQIMSQKSVSFEKTLNKNYHSSHYEDNIGVQRNTLLYSYHPISPLGSISLAWLIIRVEVLDFLLKLWMPPVLEPLSIIS